HYNRPDEAKLLLDSARELIILYRAEDYSKAYYRVLAKWYQRMGMDEQSVKMWDSALEAQRKYSERYNKLKLQLFSQQLETNTYQAALQQQKAKNKERILYGAIDRK